MNNTLTTISRHQVAQSKSVKYYPTTLLYSARADAVIAQISGFKNMPFYRSQLEALVELAVRAKHVG